MGTYIIRSAGGSERGPVSGADLKSLAASGGLRADDAVRRADGARFTAVSKIPELAAVVRSHPKIAPEDEPAAVLEPELATGRRKDAEERIEIPSPVERVRNSPPKPAAPSANPYALAPEKKAPDQPKRRLADVAPPPIPQRRRAADVEDLDDSPRPVLRFFARTIDSVLLALFMAIVYSGLALVVPEDSWFWQDSWGSMGQIVNAILIFSVWFTLESLMLSLWGTTPGKALLHTRVVGADCCHPTILTAMSRTLLLWIVGLGFNFPLFALIAGVYAFFRVRGEGSSWWDDQADTAVLHGRIGVVRGLLAFIIAGASISAVVWLLMLGEA